MSTNVVKLANIFRGRCTMLVHELTEIYKPTITRNKEKLMDVMKGGRCTTMVHELTEIYKPTITRNKEKLMDVMKEKAENVNKSGLAKQMKILKGFYTVEMAPPSSSEIKQLKHDMASTGKFFKNKRYLHITVKQAWLGFLVGLEIVLWFFLGETIGKGHIVGYAV